MAEKIDMSLDDIIKAKRVVKGKGRQPKNIRKTRNSKLRATQNIRRQPRKNLVSRNRNINDKWQHDMFNLPKNKPRSNIQTAKNVVLTVGGPGKLLISNLDFGVSDSDIQELFGEFGPLLSASVHYDSAGRSLGTAFVIFERKTDAIRGVQKYNNVPLDGRPMNIQMATSDISLLTKNNAGTRSQAQISFGRGRINNMVNRTGQTFNNINAKRRGLSRPSRRPRGGFKGRRGARGRPTKSGLNAQLDSYNDSRMEF